MLLPVTVALNCWAPPNLVEAVAGVTETVGGKTVSVVPMTLPPLQELPPLPSELLPEETTADLSADPA